MSFTFFLSLFFIKNFLLFKFIPITVGNIKNKPQKYSIKIFFPSLDVFFNFRCLIIKIIPKNSRNISETISIHTGISTKTFGCDC